MALNLEGVGGVFIRQEGKLRPLRISSATVAEEAASANSQAYPPDEPGQLQVSDTFGSSSVFTIALSTESVDTLDLDLIFNQTKADIAAIAVPAYKVITVPSTGPYQVAVDGLQADQEVDATLLSSAPPGNQFLTQVTSAPDAALEFRVVENGILFNATEAGQAVSIYYLQSGALANARGGPNPIAPVGILEFFFKYKFTRTATRKLWFPTTKKTDGANLAPGGDNIGLSLTASLPPGWNLPYLEW